MKLFGDPEDKKAQCPISGGNIIHVDEHGSFCDADVCECMQEAIDVDLKIHFTENPIFLKEQA